MKCPKCKAPVDVASALGAMASGVPKAYSKKELRLRKLRLAEARKKRWEKKDHKTTIT